MGTKKQTLTATVYDRKGRVLSKGINNYTKSHPLQARHAKMAGVPEKIMLHAEIAALVKIKRGTPYKISITRYNKSGKPVIAKPCAICELAIKEAGIILVEYTV